MSQNGSGRIWVGATVCHEPSVLFSNDYGRTWKEVWRGSLAQGNPISLYYSHDKLFMTVGGAVGKSLDNGQTWIWVSGNALASDQLPYGIGGLPQTDQVVYYVADDGTFQYSTDSGVTFGIRPQIFGARSASGVVQWMDNPNQMAAGRLGCSGGADPCYSGIAAPILEYSVDGGFSWQDKTGNWYSPFGNLWLGASGSSGHDGNVFVLVPSQVAHLRDLAKRGKLSECALGCTPPVHWANDPIDTSSGNLSYQVTDLAVSSLGGNLAFQRSYASAGSSMSGTVGYGWVNNFDTRILAPITTTHPVTVAL